MIWKTGPRLSKLAWARYDAKHHHLETKSHIIKPEGFRIPSDARRVHGISTDRALAEGKSLKRVLKALRASAEKADFLVAHNLQYDENVITAEFLRADLDPPFRRKHRICTMSETTDFCRLPGPYGYKWPKLAELHWRLFGEELEEAHDARVDLAACARCFFELKRLRIIKIRRGRV